MSKYVKGAPLHFFAGRKICRETFCYPCPCLNITVLRESFSAVSNGTFATMSEHCTIGRATPDDLVAVHGLICELAAFERMPGAVRITPQVLAQDLLVDCPTFGLFAARVHGAVVGMALFYPVYSTWEGRSLYLEDLIVTEAHRGKGIGSALFKAVAHYAATTGMARLQWQVLHWNEDALRFYRAVGAATDDEWVNCRLSGESLTAYL